MDAQGHAVTMLVEGPSGVGKGTFGFAGRQNLVFTGIETVAGLSATATSTQITPTSYTITACA